MSLRIASWLGIIGGFLGVATTFALLFLPILYTCSSVSTGGAFSTTCTFQSLIEWQEGHLESVTWDYLGIMATLSALAMITAWASRLAKRRAFILLTLGIFLGAGMLIAGFSIGFYYAPTVFLILLSSTALFFAQPSA
jgi:hypothetical protein